MSYDPKASWAQQPAWTQAAADGPPPNRPGASGIVLGVVMLVLGPLLGAALIVGGVIGSVPKLSQARQYSTGQPVTIYLPAGAEQGIWVDRAAGGTANRPDCTVTDPAGDLLRLSHPIGNQNVNSYSLLATFEPPAETGYTITCLARGGDHAFKVAPPMAVGRLVGGIVGGVFVILILVFGGLGLLIATRGRRSRWDSQYAAGAVPGPSSYPYPARG